MIAVTSDSQYHTKYRFETTTRARMKRKNYTRIEIISTYILKPPITMSAKIINTDSPNVGCYFLISDFIFLSIFLFLFFFFATFISSPISTCTLMYVPSFIRMYCTLYTLYKEHSVYNDSRCLSHSVRCFFVFFVCFFL